MSAYIEARIGQKLQQDTYEVFFSLDNWELQTRCKLAEKTQKIFFSYKKNTGNFISTKNSSLDQYLISVDAGQIKILSVNFPEKCYIEQPFYQNGILTFYRET
ncbi:MAG: hypothetical protein Tsb0015_09430 [Simkaniaceae bacterium]